MTAHETPLTLAIRNNMSAVAQAATDYKTNVVNVNTYMNNVLSSSLPEVDPEPKDWQDYVNAWETASSDALTWVNQCMGRLLSVPQDVESYNPIINSLLTDAINQTNLLIKNPQNKAALAALTNDLAQIPVQLSLVETFISGAVQALQNFQDVLPDMATQLGNLSNLAVEDNKADQKQIQELTSKINDLQNDINSLTAAIVGLGIADASAIILGVIGSIVAFPEGLLSWLIFGPAVAVATTYIVLDAEKIKADKDEIDQYQKEMDQLTAACSVLASMSTMYGNLAAQSETIQDALKAILSAWQEMAADVAVAITDVQTAIADEKSANFQAVLKDLQGAQSEWQSADSLAASLVLDLQVNNAQLQIGMSQSTVGSTLQGGQVMDVIQYFNSIGLIAKAA
ncbi:conserved hypothetical protein [Desulfatibacillum aliphaticivorans]|uniref:Enterotoxin (HBL) n=1 Tax=Desulfatibacillum aliphaticivorans TaxID=218208 RepID=B8FKT1_DESAL|nr:hypothetical protein [Desulfatibacillum aliphaticivorans]ACL04453.1 conserved hypothetical protein [Desulfatibacillum aliphaticivorans]